MSSQKITKTLSIVFISVGAAVYYSIAGYECYLILKEQTWEIIVITCSIGAMIVGAILLFLTLR